MQPIALVPWIALGALLAALAPRIVARIVGGLLVAIGVAVFAMRLHHAGPYPFPGFPDVVSGPVAILAGARLLRPPWGRSDGTGPKRLTRVLLGLSPILFLLALVAVGHEAEEVVVLRTTGPEGEVRETRLWVVDHAGAPWVVTGQGSGHDRDLVAKPRLELVRHGEARCALAERHVDRATMEMLLTARSEKYLAQRLALATRLWTDFTERDDLADIAVAIRLDPCDERSGTLGHLPGGSPYVAITFGFGLECQGRDA